VRRSLNKTITAALFLAATSLIACSLGSDELRRAEELTREGRYDEAIVAYREHMESRLEVSNRPEWENPYFYLILIGDVQLSRGEPTAALTIYEESESKLASCQDPEAKKFHETLLSDRYRAVASWYAEHEQLEKALEILRRYRHRDTLIFDAHLDRVARALTEREQKAVVNSAGR
jgi:tetratricopeptide (TPR) repeat protein